MTRPHLPRRPGRATTTLRPPDGSEASSHVESARAVPSRSRDARMELLVVGLVFVVVNLVSAFAQRPLAYRGVSDWDSYHYERVAIQLSHGERPREEAPFVYRIGTPWLATIVPGGDVVTGFRVANLTANLLALILLGIFLRSYIGSWRIRTLLLVLYVTSWLAPTRFSYFMPVYTDPWDMVFLFAGLVVVARTTRLTRRALVMTPIVFVGMMFREDAIVLAVALLFDWFLSSLRARTSSSPRSSRLWLPPPVLLLPLAAGAVAFGITHAVAQSTGSSHYSYAHAAAFWALQKPLLGYVLAWFITFGPVLGLVVFDWRNAARFLSDRGFFLGYVIGVAVLAWIGGATTERFLLWATPVVLVMLGRSLERHGRALGSSIAFVAVLIVAQALASRLFWVVPRWPSTAVSPIPVLQLLTNHAQYEDLWSWSLSIRIRAAYVLEYGACIAGIVVWLRHVSRRSGETQGLLRAS
jgi:hypothetical protein